MLLTPPRPLLGEDSRPRGIQYNAPPKERNATNRAAKNLRLLFVADAIPIELARIVEFLNAQFRDNIEVLAVEVKQFKGSAEERSTLVPNVIGHTAALGSKGGAGGPRIRSKISLDDFTSRLPSDAFRDATQQLLDVAENPAPKSSSATRASPSG